MTNIKGKISMAMNELIVRVLCDIRAVTPADGAVLYSQTFENQNSVFHAAKNILQNQLARKILFVNSGPISGYPGFSTWKYRRRKLGKLFPARHVPCARGWIGEFHIGPAPPPGSSI